jgi:hypothetical protein
MFVAVSAMRRVVAKYLSPFGWCLIARDAIYIDIPAVLVLAIRVGKRRVCNFSN